MVTLWAVTAKTNPPSACQSESSAPLQPGIPAIRVMKWLLAILICHIGVIIIKITTTIIIIIIRIFFCKLMLCSWERCDSSCWFWLAFSKVGWVGSLLVFRLISSIEAVWVSASGVCPETPFSCQFCILQSFLPIFACAGAIQRDLSLTKPGHDVSRALGVLLYYIWNQLYCFYNRKASGSFLLPLAPRK